MDYKEEFLRIYENNIKREGSTELLNWLSKRDFFTAPASGRRHLAYEGGLVVHSVNVYNRLMRNLKMEFGDNIPFSSETIAIVALLHDVCKVDFYTVDYKNSKVDGTWVQVPYYKIEDSLPYGHGEKSAYIINGFLRLTREEAMAINWHMGAWDDRVKGGSYSLGEAFKAYPLALWLHISDTQATYFDEIEDTTTD
ncbi:MAG: hydrolase [Clostridia bacterium]